MENPVSDCGDFIHAGNHAVLLVLQRIHNHLDGHFVIWHGTFQNIFILIRRLMGQLGALDADSLTEAFSNYTLIIHINQLIF